MNRQVAPIPMQLEQFLLITLAFFIVVLCWDLWNKFSKSKRFLNWKEAYIKKSIKQAKEDESDI